MRKEREVKLIFIKERHSVPETHEGCWIERKRKEEKGENKHEAMGGRRQKERTEQVPRSGALERGETRMTKFRNV